MKHKQGRYEAPVHCMNCGATGTLSVERRARVEEIACEVCGCACIEPLQRYYERSYEGQAQ